MVKLRIIATCKERYRSNKKERRKTKVQGNTHPAVHFRDAGTGLLFSAFRLHFIQPDKPICRNQDLFYKFVVTNL